MEQLSNEQLEAFDTEYVNDSMWVPIKRCIDRDFPDGIFTFLDVGGGNGVFADRVLDAYPKAIGVVLDNSQLLLSRNKLIPRKRIICGDVENLEILGEQKYDVIFFNWLLHHLVSRTYSQSRENINHTLHASIALLTKRGRVSIYENMYNGVVIDGLPSRIIYHLTTAKTISRLIKKCGANTAGVGVCFLSYEQWCFSIKRAGLRITDYKSGDLWFIPKTKERLWKTFLHIRNIYCGHFWLCL